VEVAAFVLAVIGMTTGVASLTWNIVSFLLTGARPKLTPIIGFVSPRGPVYVDATRDKRDAVASAEAEVPAGVRIAGVVVTNAGRAAFHVADWELRSEPAGISFKTLGAMTGSAAIRCDIAPGASQIFYTDLNDAYALASSAKAAKGKPQRVVVTVKSGGRTYATKPIAAANLELGAPRR
jgi:hypothetical protein